MNTKLHIDGSFQAMHKALEEANQAFESGGADRHRDALQRLGRAVMNSLAEIIETDGATDGYLYDAEGIAQDIEACYQKLIEAEDAAEPDNAPQQATHGTMSFRQQGIRR